MKDDDAWFAPKRFGYGAGLPIAWQGWVLIGAYGVAISLAGRFLAPTHPRGFGVVVVVLTAVVVALAAAHTRGGWRWRWGGRE
ncbi:hypothetical protein LK533_09915 [Sphingomonas sp. PL-96]|uniref:hypothetical protein n=1 Tax=Sphingomonas sp. PL-96 TaxID=2887201 RepID=UPI001E50E8B9|nr:hypothetical protein [Sphingomonas sp. PL-96]MCC2976987.1 hypothetical protein [Sphingomonas sp. PL-96]